MHTPITETLNRIRYRDNVDVREMAKAAEVSESKMYQVLEESTELKASEIRRLSLWLSAKGINDLSSMFLAPAYVLVPAGPTKTNGSVDDELTRSVQALGRAATAFQVRDPKAMADAIALLKEEISNLEAEKGRIS